MKLLTSLCLCLSFAALAACGGGEDACAKLQKDVCGGDDKACGTWVEKDLLEGHMDKKTCGFLTGDKDYKKWLEAAKSSYADSKKDAKEPAKPE